MFFFSAHRNSKAIDPTNPATGFSTVQVQVEQTNFKNHITNPSAVQAQPTC